MKVRRFIDELNSRLIHLVHMKNPQDLEETFDATFRAVTKYDLRKKADAEASLAEQVEALQIQIAELTTGSQSSVNYTTSISASQPLPSVQVYQPPPRMEQGQIEYSALVYYTPATNAVPPLNRPYETPPTN